MQITEYKLKDTQAEVTVLGVKREFNTRNGNPRYELATTLGTYRTASDHNYVYAIDFYALKGKKALLTLNGRGTITDIAGEF